MKNFKLIKTIEKSIRLFKRNIFLDQRGSFEKVFSLDELNRFLVKKKIHQINYVRNKKKGIIRGFHYQTESFKEQKIITCLKGTIQVIIINMNKLDKSYLKKHQFILSKKNKRLLIVPHMYANAYQTLEYDTEVLYFSTNKYSQKYEKKIYPLGKKYKKYWRLKNSILSKKDKEF